MTGWKDLWKRSVLSQEWNSEWVIEGNKCENLATTGETGDAVDEKDNDRGEEYNEDVHLLESDIQSDWRSWFHRWGDASRNERLVILSDDETGGQRSVTTDDERVQRVGRIEMLSLRYEGWEVVIAL